MGFGEDDWIDCRLELDQVHEGCCRARSAREGKTVRIEDPG